MVEKRRGGCQCGIIRYEFSCEILSCYACHCTDCQTRSGAAFTLSAIIPKSELQIVAGSPHDVDWQIGSSTLCSACGIHLWTVADIVPDFVLIRVGTLDDTTWVDPVAHMWTESAQPWIRFNENATTFPGMPDNPLQLIELWAQRQTP